MQAYRELMKLIAGSPAVEGRQERVERSEWRALRKQFGIRSGRQWVRFRKMRQRLLRVGLDIVSR